MSLSPGHFIQGAQIQNTASCFLAPGGTAEGPLCPLRTREPRTDPVGAAGRRPSPGVPASGVFPNEQDVSRSPAPGRGGTCNGPGREGPSGLPRQPWSGSRREGSFLITQSCLSWKVVRLETNDIKYPSQHQRESVQQWVHKHNPMRVGRPQTCHHL